MILKWEDGTSGVSPTCFSTPASQPSILSWHVVEVRAGEHDLEHDGRHAPADVFSFRFLTTRDAVSWQHRKVTHGGWKFADHLPGVATQSEWKVVMAGVGKCDDHWGGQSLLIPCFAKEFNGIKAASCST